LAALEKRIDEVEQKRQELERRVEEAFSRRDLDEGRRASKQLEKTIEEVETLYEKWMNESA
jgi:hypothetical protein